MHGAVESPPQPATFIFTTLCFKFLPQIAWLLLSSVHFHSKICTTSYARRSTQNGHVVKTKDNSINFGDVGLIKVVSEFLISHSKCHFWARKDGHFCQKLPFSETQKWHFGCLNKNKLCCEI